MDKWVRITLCVVILGLAAWVVAACAVAWIVPTTLPIVATAPTPTPLPTPDGGLLTNPSFEHPYECPNHAADCAAHGWRAWWVYPPPCRPLKDGCYLPCPSNCLQDNGKCAVDWGCYWAMPEFGEVTTQFKERVHTGTSAQKSFTYGRMGNWGIMQVVTVPVGTSHVKFSVFAQAWMCRDYSKCVQGPIHSDVPTTMHLKIGVDPWGGTVPTSTNVIWSAETDSFDKWSELSVIAPAYGNKVTVFTYAHPEWDYARINNDVYWDDAKLVALNLDEHIYIPVVIR